MQERGSSFPRLADVAWALTLSSALVGLGVARLTLRINPHLAERLGDAFWLHFWLISGYSTVGAVLGSLGALAVALLTRLVRPAAQQVILQCAGAAALGPLLYLLFLPDLGAGFGSLTDLLSMTRAERLLWSSGLALAVLFGGGLFIFALERLARKVGLEVRVIVLLFYIALLLGLFLAVRPHTASAALPAAPELAELPPASEPPPAPVVLLCIDGVDLDDVVLPMVEGGELPHFARLMQEGTWGSLETFEPTLSPVIWTTLITGKPPMAHGIRHFLHFRLPGMRQAIYEFPLHTGLNFRLFPLLENIPFLPVFRTPYTSNMRRAEALWNIVGRRYPVGSYRWLLSWPAEEVRGFSVAGGLGWIRFDAAKKLEVASKFRGRATHPPALASLLERRKAREVTDQDLRPYLGEGFEIDRHDHRLRAILKSFDDPAARELPVLIERFGSRFTAASFYPVDHFHHLYNAYRDRGGVFSNAIAERYRFTDARLGELFAALRDGTRVIVVSDHGYDFERNHHTYAPAGIFFAVGEGFDAGRRLEGLSVYDIAPLVLRLLDMPLPEDMPGTVSGKYRAALSRDFLAAHPESRTATYEKMGKASHEAIASPKDDELRNILKSLGYLE